MMLNLSTWDLRSNRTEPGWLIATRGLPGCGKTFRAKSLVAGNRKKWARVSRDDIRMMHHDQPYVGDRDLEDTVTVSQFAMIEALLRSGRNVISDSTWLSDRDFGDLQKLVARVGCEFRVWDMRDVPLEVCIERDAGRERPVGEAVIRQLHQRYLVGAVDLR